MLEEAYKSELSAANKKRVNYASRLHGVGAVIIGSSYNSGQIDPTMLAVGAAIQAIACHDIDGTVGMRHFSVKESFKGAAVAFATTVLATHSGHFAQLAYDGIFHEDQRAQKQQQFNAQAKIPRETRILTHDGRTVTAVFPKPSLSLAP